MSGPRKRASKLSPASNSNETPNGGSEFALEFALKNGQNLSIIFSLSLPYRSPFTVPAPEP